MAYKSTTTTKKMMKKIMAKTNQMQNRCTLHTHTQKTDWIKCKEKCKVKKWNKKKIQNKTKKISCSDIVSVCDPLKNPMLSFSVVVVETTWFELYARVCVCVRVTRKRGKKFVFIINIHESTKKKNRIDWCRMIEFRCL